MTGAGKALQRALGRSMFAPPLGRAPLFSLYRNAWPAVLLASVFLITAILAVVALLFSTGLWARRTGSALGRSLYTAFALIAVAFIPFLAYWYLLGFHW